VSAALSTFTVEPRPWGRFGALWTIFFLIFPSAFTSLVFRAAAIADIGFAPLQPHIAAFLVYGVACTIAVIAVSLWARPRGLVAAIFLFRRPAPRDWAIAVVTFVVGAALFLPSQRLAGILFGAHLRGMNFDMYTPYALPVMVFTAVFVGTFSEEVLYR
jgi:hypothetical protein